MKKYLTFLAIPFTVIADTCHLEQAGGGDWRIVCEGSGLVYHYVDVTNDVYAIADCEQLKQSLLYTAYALSQDTSANMSDDLQSILSSADTIRQQYGLDSFADDIVGSVDDIYSELTLFHRKMTDTSFDGYGSLAKSINDINCGSCPTNGASGGGSGGSCCDVDFTEIIDRLIAAEQQRAVISNQIARISTYLGVVTNQLAYNNFLVEHGFGSVTNLLFSTDYLDENVLSYYDYWWLGRDGHLDGQMWSYYKDGITTVADLLRIINYNVAETLPSLNNYNYNFQFRAFPQFTNQFASYRRDFSAYSDETTNFFSFFRGEIGVHGVLEDWTSEQADGTYHDFLTNHYLTVVRGGPLSGNQSTKTNWFSRIETLLAALVFTDSAETNTVDTSAGDAERQQLATSYGTANQAAATFSEDFKTTSQSIVTLYQNYFATFENAAMPSHVVLMRLSNSDPSEEIEISYQSDSLGVLVEACRVITTFCWASVGIFLLYKFLVWSARCVIVACQFIYRAISSVFKS